jgi:hypothetical protein
MTGADLVRGGRREDLWRVQVRPPDGGLDAIQQRVDHLTTAARRIRWSPAAGSGSCIATVCALPAGRWSELITGLPRTVARMATYVGRTRSTHRRNAFPMPPSLISSANRFRHSSTNRS